MSFTGLDVREALVSEHIDSFPHRTEKSKVRRIEPQNYFAKYRPIRERMRCRAIIMRQGAREKSASAKKNGDCCDKSILRESGIRGPFCGSNFGGTDIS